MWTPTLVGDILAVFGEAVEIRFIDLNAEAAEICAFWSEAKSKSCGRADKVGAYADRRAALAGADAVLITLSTGGLGAMENDIAIPEKYGIKATVGDTAGPGGWSRSVRNIPVFTEFARDFEELCHRAFIANYTNPMSSLTAALQKSCKNPVSGFCHAYFEIKDIIQSIFALPDQSGISVEIAGMNHFTWVTDFKIHGENGYKLLKDKIGGGSPRDVMPPDSKDELGYHSAHNLCVELYDAFKFLPYPADRHTSEFVSYALTNNPECLVKSDAAGLRYGVVRRFNVARTTIEQRRKNVPEYKKRMIGETGKLKEQSGQKPSKSRETGTDMIRAYLTGGVFMDAVNTLNIGQIQGLPSGACVETMGVTDGFGVRAVTVNSVPEYLLELMRPQAVCQSWIVEAMMTKNTELLMHALYRDPQCAFMPPSDIKAMGTELLEANEKIMSRPIFG
jgi:alpha-galactosidase